MKPEELKAIRKLAGLSREKFAAHLGCSASSIYLWETGKQQINRLTGAGIRTLAKKLRNQFDKLRQV